MSLRAYFFSLYSSTLLALAVWLSILFYSDPQTADVVTVVAFFVSLFLWLTGFISFVLFQIKIYRVNHEVIYAKLPESIRQSAFISAVMTIIISLSALQSLEWWTASLVILTFMLLELSFRSKSALTTL